MGGPTEQMEILKDQYARRARHCRRISYGMLACSLFQAVNAAFLETSVGWRYFAVLMALTCALLFRQLEDSAHVFESIVARIQAALDDYRAWEKRR